MFYDFPDKTNSAESHGIDVSLFSLNWFLCIFVDSTPVNTYLHIWDAFLFEGSKVLIQDPFCQDPEVPYYIIIQVLFRYALAVMTFIQHKLLEQTEYLAIFNTFRTEVESGLDTKKITQVDKSCVE